MTNSSNNSHLSYLDATGSIPYGMTNNYMFRLILFLHLPRNPFTSPMQTKSQEKNAGPVRTMNLWNMPWLKEIHNLQKKNAQLLEKDTILAEYKRRYGDL